MNKTEVLGYLTTLDKLLSAPTMLYIFGGAVVILLDAPERTSLDIDVAGPYSAANQGDLAEIAERIHLPVNPEPTYGGPHIEWIGPLRLCLPPPSGSGMTLWQGARLTVCTGRVEDIVVSKLIRYDPTDRADIQYLYSQFRFPDDSVRDAVERLPDPFRSDALVRENLSNLMSDMGLWRNEA